MGVAGGAERLPRYFLGTLAAMIVANPLFSALVSRFPRRRFVPVVYHFFAANLLLFFVLFRELDADGRAWLRPVFYVWTAVFSLFVVSVFWALVVDLFSTDQGQRLFGLIGVGGTVGAIAGSSLTEALAERLGTANLLLVSVGLLEAAVVCAYALTRGLGPTGGRTAVHPARHERTGGPDPELSRGGALGGIVRVFGSPYLLGMCAYMLLFTITSTFAYFEQGRIVSQGLLEESRRTAFFAGMDKWANLLAVTLQVLVTSRLLTGLGVAATAALLPLLTAGGSSAWRSSPGSARSCGSR
jgi:AAA family ATP:ADP antiporter